MARPIVVTRPEEPGRRLTAELVAAGIDAWWLPAFDLGPPSDPQRARQILANLAAFDLAIFVSPAAVSATAALLPQAWPAGTAIGAVGGATERAVRERLSGAAQAPLVSAAGDDASGSEALWRALCARPALPRRVLVLRAVEGRDWLLDRLREAGAQVQPLAVYSRSEHGASAADRAWLHPRAAAGPLASLVTSSEAVSALQHQCTDDAAVLAALRQGPALASHPRIAERLRAAGFADVREVELSAAAIAAQLRLPG